MDRTDHVETLEPGKPHVEHRDRGRQRPDVLERGSAVAAGTDQFEVRARGGCAGDRFAEDRVVIRDVDGDSLRSHSAEKILVSRSPEWGTTASPDWTSPVPPAARPSLTLELPGRGMVRGQLLGEYSGHKFSCRPDRHWGPGVEQAAARGGGRPRREDFEQAAARGGGRPSRHHRPAVGDGAARSGAVWSRCIIATAIWGNVVGDRHAERAAAAWAPRLAALPRNAGNL